MSFRSPYCNFIAKSSEGKRDSNIELARADRYALDAIAKALRDDNCGQTEVLWGQLDVIKQTQSNHLHISTLHS